MVLLDASKQSLRKSRLLDLQDESEQHINIVKSLEPEAYGLDLSAVAF
jgi:hypothetical protein